MTIERDQDTLLSNVQGIGLPHHRNFFRVTTRSIPAAWRVPVVSATAKSPLLAPHRAQSTIYETLERLCVTAIKVSAKGLSVWQQTDVVEGDICVLSADGVALLSWTLLGRSIRLVNDAFNLLERWKCWREYLCRTFYMLKILIHTSHSRHHSLLPLPPRCLSQATVCARMHLTRHGTFLAHTHLTWHGRHESGIGCTWGHRWVGVHANGRSLQMSKTRVGTGKELDTATSHQAKILLHSNSNESGYGVYSSMRGRFLLSTVWLRLFPWFSQMWEESTQHTTSAKVSTTQPPTFKKEPISLWTRLLILYVSLYEHVQQRITGNGLFFL